MSHLHVERSQQDYVIGDSLLSQTALFAQNKNDNEGDNGGEQQNIIKEMLADDKNRPGLMFLSVLTLWHFWIGPALRPIILDMRHQ